MNQPLVSIGLPAFKGAHFAEALRSIKNQTYRNIEVIVQDDASPDDLKSIFDAEVGDDPRFIYDRNEKNTAPYFVKNWQKTIDKAHGEFFVLAGDDDLYEPDFIEELLALFDKHQGVDLVFARHDCFNSDGVVCVPHQVAEFQRPLEFLYSAIVMGRWYQAQIALIRMSALKSIGGFVDLPAAWPSDLVTWTMLANHGVAMSEKILSHWRFENNISSSNCEYWSLLKIEAALDVRSTWTKTIEGTKIVNADEEWQKIQILEKMKCGYLPWLVYSEFNRLTLRGLRRVLKRLVKIGEISQYCAYRILIGRIRRIVL